MITLGKSPALLTHGDCFPARLYHGKQQLGGYQKKHMSGQSQVHWESSYRGVLPKVTVMGSGYQRQDHGKNLCDLSQISVSYQNTHSFQYQDGIITAEGNPGNAPLNGYAGEISLAFPILHTAGRPICITIPVKLLRQGKWSDEIQFFIGDHWNRFKIEMRWLYLTLGTYKNMVLVLNPDFDIETIIIRLNNNRIELDLSHTQIEYGTTETPFEPHWHMPSLNVPSIPAFLEDAKLNGCGQTSALPTLRAVDNVRDELNLTTGQLTRRIWYQVLDETADWKPETYLYGKGYYAPLDHSPIPYQDAHAFVSTMQIHSSLDDVRPWGFYLAQRTFEFCCPELDTREKLDSWLKQHPIEIWYALSKPIVEQIAPCVLIQTPGSNQLSLTGGETELQVEAYGVQR